MNTLKACTLAAAMCSFAAAEANAGYLVIDEFSGPATTLSVNSSTTTASIIDQAPTIPGTILGGVRDLELKYLSGGSSANTASVLFDGTQGAFYHEQGAGTKTQTTITYNGTGTGAAIANFAGMTGLEVGLLYSDQGLAWKFTLLDIDGEAVSGMFLTPKVDDGSGGDSPEVVRVLLAFSTFSINTSFDYSKIASIKLLANFDADGTELDTDPTRHNFPRGGLDVKMAYIYAVPEPATLALFGAGLLGLGLIRRRRAA